MLYFKKFEVWLRQSVGEYLLYSLTYAITEDAFPENYTRLLNPFTVHIIGLQILYTRTFKLELKFMF